MSRCQARCGVAAVPCQRLCLADRFLVMSRYRGLFPLPCEPVLNDASFVSRCSRKVQRRARRKQHKSEWYQQGLTALNDLAGYSTPVSANFKRSEVVSSCLDSIRSAYFDLPEAPSVALDPEGALSELLCSSAYYGVERQDVLPFDDSKLSLPQSGEAPVQLHQHVKPSDLHFFRENCSAMLRSSEEADSLIHSSKVVPYCDPALFSSELKYSKFLLRLKGAGMLRFKVARGKKGDVGIFFVRKKDGSLRLIFDTRALNCRFQKPPKIRLPSTSAFSSVEVDADMDAYLASGDISNAFYHLAVPVALADYFGLPRIRAGTLGISEIDGVPIAPSTELLPLLTVLPMGWSWSVLFCQSVLERQMDLALIDYQNQMLRGGRDFKFDWILDHRPGVLLRSDISYDKSSCEHSVGVDVAVAGYVDNFAVEGTNPEVVTEVNSRIASRLRAVGLVVHEVFDAALVADFIGLCFVNGRIGIKASKFWKTKAALDAILLRRKISGDMLEVMLGHLVWLILGRREALSILVHCYHFVRVNGDSYVDIWPFVRKELWNLRAILPLLRANQSRPWYPIVAVSDASPYGLGVCTKAFDKSLVRGAGSLSEVWRYKVESSIKARVAALSGTEAKLETAENEPKSIDPLACDAPSGFDEASLVNASYGRWTVVYSASHSLIEHITITEGRALLHAIRHIVRSKAALNKRLLFLVDNMSLCLAVNKGRSSKPKLASILQEIAATCVATGCKVVCRWVPSELNPADRPSRKLLKVGGRSFPKFASTLSPAPPVSALVQHGWHNGGRSDPADPALHDYLRCGNSRSQEGCQKEPGETNNGSQKDQEHPGAEPISRPLHPRDQLQLSGGKVGHLSNAGKVPGVGNRFLPMVPEKSAGLEGFGYTRPIPCDVFRPPVLRAGEAERVLEAVVCPQIPDTKNWQDGQRIDAKGHAGTKRMAEVIAQPAALTLPLARPCSRHRTSRLRGASMGSFSLAGPIQDVHSPRGVRKVASKAIDSPHPERLPMCRQMVLQPFSGGRPRQGKNWRVRRNCYLGSGGMGREAIRAAPPKAFRRSAVAFSAPAAGPTFSENHFQDGDAAFAAVPLCPPAWRRVGRRAEWDKVENRSENARGMEQRCVATTLRQRGSHHLRATQAPSRCAGIRCKGGAAPRGSVLARCSLPSPATGAAACLKGGVSVQGQAVNGSIVLSKKSVQKRLKHHLHVALDKAKVSKHQCFLELFAGSGRVSHYLRSRGYAVISFNSAFGSEFDLSLRAVANVIFGWIRSGIILGIHLGTPCDSWSLARRGPPGSA